MSSEWVQTFDGPPRGYNPGPPVSRSAKHKLPIGAVAFVCSFP
ncbi:hypothetical protein IMCC20628_01836 [Hoeflea sp. IMCC20628]|nr:hypothetical protein IMCC20628_01836 [Hoeflea sp. IMCC20628]